MERKPTKIKHSTLIGNFENGGLKDIDIESKLKVLKLSWIKRLLNSNFHLWKTLAAKLLEPVGGTKIFHSNLSMPRECHKVFTSLPTFYKQLIEFWELTSISICDEPSVILNQSVDGTINTSLKVVALSMTLYYQIKVLITSRIFLSPLHAILNYRMKSKSSSDSQRV